MFDDVLLPPYPGDDGIAIGCCAYRLFGNWYGTSFTASSAFSILSEADHEGEDCDALDNANGKDKDANDTTRTTPTETETTMKGKDLPSPLPPLWDGSLYPYLGPYPTDIEIAEAIRSASPWIDNKKCPTTLNPSHQK